jgi:ABC-2 type transport system ATP-binding protein
VSSHQLNEVQEIADRVVILNRGQLVRAGSIKELSAGNDAVVVRSPDPAPLGAAIAAAGGFAQHTAPDALEVRGLPIEQIGHLAFTAGVELHELSTRTFDLEDLFFQLTAEAQPPHGGMHGVPRSAP